MPAQVSEGYAVYDAYTKLLDRNGQWIQVADAKAAIILAFLTAIFPTMIGSAVPTIKALARTLPHHTDVFATLPIAALISLTVLFAALAAYTFVQVLLTLVPRLIRNNKPGMVFFGDIAAQSAVAWQQQVNALNGKELANQILEQVHATACIAHLKHMHVRRATSGILVTVLVGMMLFVKMQIIS